MQFQAREKMADCVDSCSAIEPLMRAIDCVPESNDGGCRIGNENGASIFDSIRNLKGNNKSTRKNFDVTKAGDRKEILKERLEMFVSKKWLTQNEYQKYIAFLSTFDRSDCLGESGNYALKELEKELDATEEKMSKQPTSWRDMITSTFMTTTPSVATTTYNTNTSLAGVDVNNDKNRQPLATATNRVVNGVNAPTIVYPKDVSNCLSEDAISELFVETCFFARLGFVQPPCCLSCTYKEALKSYTPVINCQRWVIWRRDANKTFDPSHANNMRDNAIVVQCQSARKLIAGKMVDGFQWDKRGKILNKKSESMHAQRSSHF
jgi:hypothetical protein